MIRVLENGKYRVITCTCGCKYSFDIIDLNENNQVKCPECGILNSATVKEESKQ